MDLTHDYANRLARVTEPQYGEALAVLAKDRPLCVVELRKAPATYAWLASVATAETIRYYEGDEGPEMVVAQPGFYGAYLDLLDRRALYDTRAQFITAMGTLMGILHTDPTLAETWKTSYDWWTRDAECCPCSKCGGPLTAREQLDKDARARRTQPHARSAV